MRHAFTPFAALLALAALAAPARAADLTGRWGLGLEAGWAGRLGSQAVRDTAGNGTLLGASISRGLTPHWRAALNYANIDLRGKRLQPVTLSGLYAFFPEKKLTPFAELGLGGARGTRFPDSRGNETSLAVKAAAGLEYALCSTAVASARASLYHAGRNTHGIAHEVDAATFSLGLTYWFGGARPAAAPAPAPVVAAPPAPAPAPVVVKKAPEKVTIALAVEFDTNKDIVKPQYDDQLKKVSDFLKAYPDSKAEIEGHTDSMGAAAANKDLSQRRAAAVRQALIDRFGADGARLSAAGYGQEKPIASNDTVEGRAQNRRVVATFTGTKE